MAYYCKCCCVNFKSKKIHAASKEHKFNAAISEIENAIKEKLPAPKQIKYKLPLHLIAQSVLPLLSLREQAMIMHLFNMDNDEQAMESYNRAMRPMLSPLPVPYSMRFISFVEDFRLPLSPLSEYTRKNMSIYHFMKINNTVIRKIAELMCRGMIAYEGEPIFNNVVCCPIVDGEPKSHLSDILRRLMISNIDELLKIRDFIEDGDEYTKRRYPSYGLSLNKSYCLSYLIN